MHMRLLPFAAIGVAFALGTGLASAQDAPPEGAAPTAETGAALSGSPATSQPQEAASTEAPMAASPLASIAATLPATLEDVQIVGPWGESGSKGVWRTVMLRDPQDDGKAHFFVQQIAGTGASATVASSIAVPDIAEVDGEVVGYRADEPSPTDPDGLMLFFEIVPLDGEIAETYQLQVFPDGTYDFGFATN